MWSTIRQDFQKENLVSFCLKYLSSKGNQAVILYRISSYLYQKKFIVLAKIVKNYSIKKTGADIGEGAVIGKGLSIGHPVGIVVGGNVILGENNFFLSGVVLGATSNSRGGGKIIVGDNVYFGSGAKIIGNIKIGNNVNIGANAVVIKDVPDNVTCVGVPGRNIINEGNVC